MFFYQVTPVCYFFNGKKNKFQVVNFFTDLCSLGAYKRTQLMDRSSLYIQQPKKMKLATFLLVAVISTVVAENSFQQYKVGLSQCFLD